METEKEKEKEVYSYHTFIFPFLWNGKDGHKKNLELFIKYFEENKNWTDINWVDERTISKEGDDNWKCIYKEYQYFHPYVRKAIYGYDGGVVRNFCFEPAWENEDASFVIKKIRKIEENGKEEEIIKLDYSLHISSIQLKIYNTEVALLIMQCENYEHRTLGAVKDINDYGRRIYAPYIPKSEGITADTLCIKLSGTDKFEEDFAGNYKKAAEKRENNSIFFEMEPVKMLLDILNYGSSGKKFVSTPENKEEKKKTGNQFYIYPAMDDRMFVMCAVSDKVQTGKMLQKSQNGKYFFERLDELQKSLYELAYVDNNGGCTCQNADMRREYIEKCVYRRWLNYGSIYTVTYQAMVMLSTASEDDFLYENFRTQYFQMACLCLAERASIIRFNQMVEECSVKIEQKGMKSKLVKDLMDIQERFASFQGQLCFEEVTSQEQGIELFEMMKSAMFIDRELGTIKELIGNMYEIANTSSGYNVNVTALAFTWISAFLAIGAVIYDKLSVADTYIVNEVYPWNQNPISHDYSVEAIVGLIVISVVIWLVVKFLHRRKK